MRPHRSALFGLASSILLPLTAVAAPAVLQPPVTGSMYNGNNVAPPSFNAPDKANYDATDATTLTVQNQASGGAKGGQANGAGVGENTSRADASVADKSGGQASSGLRDNSGGQSAAATGATLGATGTTGRAGGGN